MKYKDLDFVGLTKILRAHATQIIPPGMRELKNIYVARSDNSVTLRPDLLQELTGVPSLSADLQGGNQPEFLTGIYRVLDIDGYIYFSNIGPFSWENELRTNISTTYKEGTITTNGVRAVAYGTDTLWLQYVWPGCLIREKDSEDWYLIEAVKSDEYIVTNGVMPAYTGSEYVILRNHPLTNGAWPVVFEKLGDLLVYNPAKPVLPVDQQRISGPFFSDIGKIDLFGGVWNETQPEVDPVTGNFNVVSAGYDTTFDPFGFNEVGYIYPLIVAGENGIMVSCAQWIGDFNQDNSNFENLKRDNIFLEPQVSTYDGKLAYPKGNGFPTSNRYQLLASSADSNIVGIQYRSPLDWLGLGFSDEAIYVIYRNGDLVVFDNADDQLNKVNDSRTEEERVTLGPWIPSQVYGPVNVLDGAANGIYRGWVFGDDGKLSTIDGSVWSSGTTEDLYAGTTGERVQIDPADLHYGFQQFFVGAAGTILLNALPTEAVDVSDSASGTEDLYDITYLHALDEGVYGLGTLVAVGSYGTIIFSDDGGYSWEQAYSGTDQHIRAISPDADGQCAMAVGDGGTCLITEDAETWEPLNISSDDFADVSFDPTRGDWVIIKRDGTDPIRVKRRFECGARGPVIAKKIGVISTDPRDTALSIIWTGSLFIAAGTKIWTSPTGVTWTEVSDIAGIACLAHHAGVVIGVGGEGLVARSMDGGNTWSIVTESLTSGPILSVIYDDYQWYCCGDKTILISTDSGATWDQDLTFTANEEPKLLAYRGDYFDVGNLDYTNPHGIEELPTNPLGPFSSAFGNIYVLTKSGKWYATTNLYEVDEIGSPPPPVYGPEWYDKTQGSDASNNYLPFAAPNTRLNPSSFVAARTQFQAAAVGPASTRQFFWSTSLGYIQFEHLEGISGPSGDRKNIPDQEPSVLRTPAEPVSASDYLTNHNCLLYHGAVAQKGYSTGILFWLHNRKLLLSTDAGQTWSKGRTVIIPTRNGVYDEPESMKLYPGTSIKSWAVTDRDLNLRSNPMVSNGTDVFCSSYYQLDGLVFLSLTWDGIHLYTGDPDDVQEGVEDVIPDTVQMDSSAGEHFVFTFYPVELS